MKKNIILSVCIFAVVVISAFVLYPQSLKWLLISGCAVALLAIITLGNKYTQRRMLDVGFFESDEYVPLEYKQTESYEQRNNFKDLIGARVSIIRIENITCKYPQFLSHVSFLNDKKPDHIYRLDITSMSGLKNLSPIEKNILKSETLYFKENKNHDVVIKPDSKARCRTLTVLNVFHIDLEVCYRNGTKPACKQMLVG